MVITSSPSTSRHADCHVESLEWFTASSSPQTPAMVDAHFSASCHASSGGHGRTRSLRDVVLLGEERRVDHQCAFGAEARHVVGDEHASLAARLAVDEGPPVERARESCAPRAEHPQPGVINQQAAGVECECAHQRARGHLERLQRALSVLGYGIEQLQLERRLGDPDDAQLTFICSAPKRLKPSRASSAGEPSKLHTSVWSRRSFCAWMPMVKPGTVTSSSMLKPDVE